MGNMNSIEQAQFNSLLFNYLLIFVVLTIIAGSLLHYYMTKKLVNPVQNLIKSTKKIKRGEYPEPVSTSAHGEIRELTVHFNGMIEQLKRNDADRSKMISDLSHELRTPLTNLNGYLKALRDGNIKGDSELYHSLLKESKRITEMIEQMELLKEWGEISSQEYIEYEERNIAELIRQSVDMFWVHLEREKMQITVDTDDCEFRMHSDGVQQVMTNLIDNAVNYHQGDESIQIKGRFQNELYQVSVKSYGPAIPDAQQARIFERLYRMDTSRNRETGGHGLGLAIAKEIIDKHNGEIDVISEDGINTFWFTLPVQ